MLFRCLTVGSLLSFCLVTATAQNFVLDSVYVGRGINATADFAEDERTYFLSYDDENRPLAIETQRYVGGDEWENWRRREYTYTTTGDLLILVTFYWSSMSETWMPGKERSYTYDAEGNMLTRVVRTTPEPGSALENTRRWQYAYEEPGLQVEALYQQWEDGAWTNVSRQLWDYNAADLPANQMQQLWSGSVWEDARRRMWNYNSNILSSVTEQSYDADADIWVNERRLGYQSDDSELWNESVEQDWDTETSSWRNVGRQLIEYGNDQTVDFLTNQVWEQGEWLNRQQSRFEDGGANINILSDRWDAQASAWGAYERHQFRFNNEGLQILKQGWQYWSEQMTAWLNDTGTSRWRYFWSENTVGTAEPLPDAACRWPNPYHTGQMIHCELLPQNGTITLELINSAGQIVHQQQVVGGADFQINAQLPYGWYLSRLSQRGQLLHVQPLVFIP